MLLLHNSKAMSYSEFVYTVNLNIVIFALEKTLESPLGCKDIKPINLKRNPA